MAKRRKATPVTLTPYQRERLENLWFVYGNYGPKTTPGNHSFIQGLLENGIDLRPLITKRSRKSEIPTPECEAAVDEILSQKSASEARDERSGGDGMLRLISNTPEHTRPAPDTKLKAILDEMRRSKSASKKSSGDEDDTPDAA